MQHTHFASATHMVSSFLGVLFVGTVWRLGCAHGVTSRSRWIRGLARAGFLQY